MTSQIDSLLHIPVPPQNEEPIHLISLNRYNGSQRLKINQYVTMVDESSEAHKLHLQFSLLFDFIMVRYAIDVFRPEKFKWSKSNYSRGIRKRFSYRYFNENNIYATYRKVCEQMLLFRKLFRDNKWSFVQQSEYIDFINKNLAVVVNELFIPIEENNTDILPMIPFNISAIVGQFRKIVMETQTKTKSSKINYDVAKELGLL
jgi:hypothetical protein